MSLNDLYNEIAIQENLKSDRAQEFCERKSEFLKSAKRKKIYLTNTETEHENQIAHIDVEIRELRKHTHSKKKATYTPKSLWEY